ncbi:MAG: hypothetical protein NZM38_02715 [Cytophagales bacterium]|nr:hypothetical protein [Cytophagales bacterium]MDW8383666.1 hypothetical protein [Flammeovirgaceae bacterium]
MNGNHWADLQKFVLNNLEITFIIIFCGLAIIFLLVALITSGNSKKENTSDFSQDIELEQLVQELKKASINSRWLLEQYELRVRQKDDEMITKIRRIAEIDEAIRALKANLDLLPDSPKGSIQKIRKLIEKAQQENLFKRKIHSVNPHQYFIIGMLTGIGICLVLGILAIWLLNIELT